jgi:histidine kinase/DNA gyrase B/HSP90-like ATPase
VKRCAGRALNNAAKFTPSKGRIEIWVRAKAEYAIIRVRDNGLGIAHADLGSIFDMFVQLGSGETHSVAGLGLALARSFITLHGGEITAHSAGPRKGSEFRIRLPLADAPLQDRDEPDMTPPVHNARRVLIVDDNVDAATSLATFLEYKGHSVRTLGTKCEARRTPWHGSRRPRARRSGVLRRASDQTRRS